MVNWRFNPCETCCLPPCTDCCDGLTASPSSIIIDLGTPGMTSKINCDDSTTEQCEDLEGEFTVSDVGQVDCNWLFTSTWCAAPGDVAFGNLSVFAEIKVENATECFWQVRLQFSAGSTVHGLVIYESTPTTFTNAICGLTSPYTLTLQSGDFSFICNGSFNNTITIEAAP